MMVCHSMGLKKYTKALLYGIQNRSTGRRIVKWIGQGFVRETTDGEYEKTAKGRACGRRKNDTLQKTII